MLVQKLAWKHLGKIIDFYPKSGTSKSRKSDFCAMSKLSEEVNGKGQIFKLLTRRKVKNRSKHKYDAPTSVILACFFYFLFSVLF